MHTALMNYIAGELRPAENGATYNLTNPSSAETYATAPQSGDADVDLAFTAAAEAFKAWGKTTPAFRQKALIALAASIERRAEEFADIECQATGKPRGLFLSEELALAIDHMRFFAGAARVLNGVSAGEYMEGHTSYVRREPVGVVGQVAPWNYPLMMAVWKIAPALAAGNTVVLKPAETTPASALLLAEIAGEHLPTGVLNVICGDKATGRAMVEHPVPAMVSITGSVRAGVDVAETAAKSVKRTHLELGGKAPAIVFSDADFETAVEAISVGGFFNGGQDCTAACRAIVHESIYGDFVQALAARAKHIVCAGPEDEEAFFGPLNNEHQLRRVHGFIQRLPDHASVETGGQPMARAGYFYPPTVVSGVRQDDEIVRNEVFGPVITVQSFATEVEALRLANDSEYGLAASVFTTNHATATQASNALDFGCVWINTHIPLVAEMPHGGFKHSGYGKDLSVYGLEDYTRVKHVMTFVKPASSNASCDS